MRLLCNLFHRCFVQAMRRRLLLCISTTVAIYGFVTNVLYYRNGAPVRIPDQVDR